MKKTGWITAKVARKLSKELSSEGIKVLFDHGDPAIDDPRNLGQIASWFGNISNRQSRLALVDIAFIRAGTDDVLLLAEIEDTSSNPKVILGDAYSIWRKLSTPFVSILILPMRLLTR